MPHSLLMLVSLLFLNLEHICVNDELLVKGQTASKTSLVLVDVL